MAENAPRPRLSRFQRAWLAVYWTGFGSSSLFALWATIGLLLGIVGLPQWLPTMFGWAAALLAALAGTRLSAIRASDLAFVMGTGTARAIALGWSFVVAGIFFGSIVGVLADIDSDELVAPITGVIGTIGAVALLAMFGPGYSEYCEARHVTLGSEWSREARGLARRARRAAAQSARSDFSKQSEKAEST
ncbi:hypothetical protein [uncultured Schumannella sp.]|uniref:hypothetical protein n=1 Tax=uncultured Schumannella sp. TaxID=1195956 RepID=UPI0025CD6A34|nr:hypothetical protein [uncultured Schumannella sp.]